MDLRALLPFVGLFGLFAVLLATFFLRSRHNKAHPPELDPPHVKARRQWTAAGLWVVAVFGCAYLYLSKTNFQPTWMFVFWAVLAAFIGGAWMERSDIARKVKDDHPPPGP